MLFQVMDIELVLGSGVQIMEGSLNLISSAKESLASGLLLVERESSLSTEILGLSGQLLKMSGRESKEGFELAPDAGIFTE